MIVLAYIIHFLGVVAFSALITWIYHVSIEENPYRPFCSYWIKYIFNYRVYHNEIVHYYQRLTRGISYDDAWNFDGHLAGIISQGLVHVRDSGLAPDLSCKDWDDMIVGIQNYEHLCKCYGLNCPLSHKQLEKDFNHGMMLLIKHYRKLWI